MRLVLPSRRRLLRGAAIAVAVLAALPILGLAVHTVAHPPTQLMLLRRLQGVAVTRTWVPLAAIDRSVVVALIASEDNRFCEHHGIDWDELREVVGTPGGPRRGGSTLTMQVTKNLFLWNGRSVLRKALEIPLALLVDLVWSKERILETYLNIAEWGPSGEFGVEAGARRAFGRSAADLTARQAAQLVAMLPNPHTRDARAPSARLVRVAAIVRSRAAASPELADCIGARPR